MTEKMVKVTIRLPDALVLRAKACAILNDMDLQDLVCDAVGAFCNKKLPADRKELARLRKGTAA